MTPREIAVGELGEGGPWEVVINHTVETWGEAWQTMLCPHAINVRDEPQNPLAPLRSEPPRNWMVKRWEVPVVLKAYNEGGYNHTLLCWGCVQEAMARD